MNKKIWTVVLIVVVTLAFNGTVLAQDGPSENQPPDLCSNCPFEPSVEMDRTEGLEMAEDMFPECGQTGIMTVLFLGTDNENPPLGADLIRLGVFDFNAGTVAIKAYSRDLWIESVSEYLGKSFDKALENDEEPGEVMMQIFADAYGVTPDHYVALSIDDLAILIDKMGGVDFTVPETIITDRNYHFLVGDIHLDGKLASEYVRANGPYGDKGRMRRQDLFLKALKEKLMAEDTLPIIPELLDSVQEVLLTDMEADQLSGLACLALSVPEESIELSVY